MSQPSSSFYQRKADETRALAEYETNPVLADQHRRLAAMYQSLADHATGKPTTRIIIPKGMLRSA